MTLTEKNFSANNLFSSDVSKLDEKFSHIEHFLKLLSYVIDKLFTLDANGLGFLLQCLAIYSLWMWMNTSGVLSKR